MSSPYPKWFLLCVFSCVLQNPLPAFCETSDPWEQFSAITVSDNDRTIIEQQTGKTRYISAWHDSGFLKKYRILQISVPGMGFEIMILPAGGSIGIFAFDGKKVLYLNGSEAKNNLSMVLKNSNVPIEQAKPETIASLLCLTLLQHHNDSAVILTSSNDLQGYSGAFGNGGYTVDQGEFKKCESQIKPPHIVGNKKTGWKIYFYTLHGVMHDKRNVCSYEIDISPKFDIDIHEKTLTSKVFSSVPKIMY